MAAGVGPSGIGLLTTDVGTPVVVSTVRRSMLPAVAFVTARSESVVGGGSGVVPLLPLLLPPPQPQVRLQSIAHTSPRRPDRALCTSGLRPLWTPNESSESSRLISLVRYIASLPGN